MKLKHVSCVKIKDVPDHILQEIMVLASQISLAIYPLLAEKHGNVVLSALNFVHCGFIKQMVADRREELEKAAILEGKALYENMQTLIEKMEKGEL